MSLPAQIFRSIPHTLPRQCFPPPPSPASALEALSAPPPPDAAAPGFEDPEGPVGFFGDLSDDRDVRPPPFSPSGWRRRAEADLRA